MLNVSRSTTVTYTSDSPGMLTILHMIIRKHSFTSFNFLFNSRFALSIEAFEGGLAGFLGLGTGAMEGMAVFLRLRCAGSLRKKNVYK